MYADAFLAPWHESARELVPGRAACSTSTPTSGRTTPTVSSASPSSSSTRSSWSTAARPSSRCTSPRATRSGTTGSSTRPPASDGRLVAFCRLDPRADPVAEAERALDRGAVGIKLHPRAENFRLADPDAAGIYAVAHERGLPLIVHAGRGIPALGRDAVDLARQYPDMKLILAHEGICDLAWIWRDAQELPNLFFDTAWWSPADHLSLFAFVPPGQILFGSDAPYGTPLQGRVRSPATRCRRASRPSRRASSWASRPRA